MPLKFTSSDIISLYKNTEISYRLVWDLNKSMAMHYGFWDKCTKTLRDALLNENKYLANMAKIKATDKILDAGCGVGGSAVFLAKKFACSCVGISLSLEQIMKARKNAKKYKLVDLTDFKKMDFHNLNFSDESFNVVWAIESICHATNKKRFIEEAFRVLKPGGRLLIADAFLAKTNFSEKEKGMLNDYIHGWAVSSLRTEEFFQKEAMRIGFRNSDFIDKTKNIRRSSKRLFYMSLLAIPIARIQLFFNFITEMQSRHSTTLYKQYKTLKEGLWHYGVFMAEK